MPLILNNIYDIGQEVYLRTDADQMPHMVTGIKILPGEVLVYQLSMCKCYSEHYECEISDSKMI